MFGGLGAKWPPEPPPKPEEKPVLQFLDPRLDESAKIVQWRTEQLADAGFPIKYAVKLAQNREIDWHRAADLLKRCEGDGELAFRILT